MTVRTLTVTNKRSSFGSVFEVKDESSRVVYQARSDFAPRNRANPTWRIWLYQGGRMMAIARSRAVGQLFLHYAWDIEGDLGLFSIEPPPFSLVPKMRVKGGFYDGATMTTSIFNAQIRIETAHAVRLAKVKRRMLGIGGTQKVELISENERDVVFIAICMSVLQMTQLLENSGSD